MSSMNLRLRPDEQAALRAASANSGRSQQELLREALDQYLGLHASRPTPKAEWDQLLAAGKILLPRGAYRKVEPTITLPQGVTSLDLMDREDRF